MGTDHQHDKQLRDANTYAHGDCNPNDNTHADGDCNSRDDPDDDANPRGNSYASYPDANTYSHPADLHSNRDSFVYPDANTCFYRNSYIDTYPNTGGNRNANSDTSGAGPQPIDADASSDRG